MVLTNCKAIHQTLHCILMLSLGLTWVRIAVSELRLSRLSTKRIDWKSSWILARNWSSSIPQVAREYRMRDCTMNLKRYSKACWKWKILERIDTASTTLVWHSVVELLLGIKRWLSIVEHRGLEVICGAEFKSLFNLA